ncbi:hypothetical protein JCM18909_1051 [Cutibacterium acnes JCM 18909]|nr:hypothetical protein JCM18909_1051 [Cutibacterium acnes JCM 18909]
MRSVPALAKRGIAITATKSKTNVNDKRRAVLACPSSSLRNTNSPIPDTFSR